MSCVKVFLGLRLAPAVSFALFCRRVQYFLYLINTWDKRAIIPAQPQKSFSPWHFYHLIKGMTKWQFFTDLLLQCEPRLFVKGARFNYIWIEQVIVLLFHLCGFCWNYENQLCYDLFSVHLGRIPSSSRPQGSSVAPFVSQDLVSCCLIWDKLLLSPLRVYGRNH